MNQSSSKPLFFWEFRSWSRYFRIVCLPETSFFRNRQFFGFSYAVCFEPFFWSIFFRSHLFLSFRFSFPVSCSNPFFHSIIFEFFFTSFFTEYLFQSRHLRSIFFEKCFRSRIFLGVVSFSDYLGESLWKPSFFGVSFLKPFFVVGFFSDSLFSLFGGRLFCETFLRSHLSLRFSCRVSF